MEQCTPRSWASGPVGSSKSYQTDVLLDDDDDDVHLRRRRIAL